MSKIPRLFELMPEKHKKAPAKRLHSARRGFLKKTRRQETILPEQGKNGGLQDCSACIFIIPHAAHKVNKNP